MTPPHMADALGCAGTHRRAEPAPAAWPVLVTRPQPQADQWVQALTTALQVSPASAALQIQPIQPQRPVVALPLIRIVAVTTAPAYLRTLQQVWADMSRYAAVFFVSAAAVEHFFAVQPHAAGHWRAAGVRAWAPGLGTRQALRKAGVPDADIDSPPPSAHRFDSESLWPLLAPQLPAMRQQGRGVLHVRGTNALVSGSSTPDTGHGRDWLAQQLRQAGVAVHTVVAYQRCPPVWDASLHAQAVHWAETGSIWVFGSAQAIGHLQQLLPQQTWQRATAIATHPRIGDTARQAGFGHVLQAQPLVAAVAQSIQSLA